jgi:hypothetical protein
MIISLVNLKQTQWFQEGAVYVDRKHIISMQRREDRWHLRLTSGAEIVISIKQFLELDLINTAGT